MPYIFILLIFLIQNLCENLASKRSYVLARSLRILLLCKTLHARYKLRHTGMHLVWADREYYRYTPAAYGKVQPKVQHLRLSPVQYETLLNFGYQNSRIKPQYTDCKSRCTVCRDHLIRVGHIQQGLSNIGGLGTFLGAKQCEAKSWV